MINRMLQAKTSEGEFITLANMMPAEIKKLKMGKETFTCPVCGGKVIMKAGTKVIPHFAHHHVSSCAASEGGEGVYHEKGKLLLYEWLLSQQLSVSLEAYLPEIQQRPDILLMIGSKTIAIEYQCARISPSIIYERNKGYEKAGITPIWIMGEQLLKRKSSQLFKMDSFLQLFIHQFSSGFPPIIYFFCPHTHQFLKIMDLYSIGNGFVHGLLQIRKLQDIDFLECFRFGYLQTSDLWKLWRKEKLRFRLKPIRQFGSDHRWNKWLYEKGLHRDRLPSIIHMPISSQHFLKQPLWQWQGKLVIEALAPFPIGGTLSLTRITSLLRSPHPQINFPLIKHFNNPFEEYMLLLCRLGYFQEIYPKQYQKISPISFYSSLEEAIKADNELVLQFIR
ncbi:competence protein CoiA [Oceanobacillus manasiensis]|uniref:competence protein CoiA n=1 Tax=Oceanobacillus manasiensis TaxID=586413 RepID=UPI001595E3DC|nr:competence protein CoiA family protein [Oceanobacillus manasiensis]